MLGDGAQSRCEEAVTPACSEINGNGCTWSVPAHPVIPSNTMSCLFLLFSICTNSAVVWEGGDSEVSTHGDSVGIGSLFAPPDPLSPACPCPAGKGCHVLPWWASLPSGFRLPSRSRGLEGRGP